MVLSGKIMKHLRNCCRYSSNLSSKEPSGQCVRGTPGYVVEQALDWDYLLDPKNTATIRSNIRNRKGVGDIDYVLHLYKIWMTNRDPAARRNLEKAALLIPNRTSSHTPIGSTNFSAVARFGHLKDSKDYRPVSFRQFAESNGLLRYGTALTSGLVFGQRSYFLIGDLARLERALVSFALDKLLAKGWEYISVPDLLPEHIINSCGFVTTGKQNQIFKTREDQGGLCLIGTSEMSLAAYFADTKVTQRLPQRVVSFSPCFRAEEAKNRIDKDFYRLHQFTKVEMFAVVSPDESDSMLDEIVANQLEIFSDLDLHFRLLEMPSEELGAAAYRKFDCEAWMYNKSHWGEISSASNCTDYQTRRLAITSDSGFPHTVNGTACAVPRVLIALIEQNQLKDGTVSIPKCLQPYMKKTVLEPNNSTKGMQWITSRGSNRL